MITFNTNDGLHMLRSLKDGMIGAAQKLVENFSRCNPGYKISKDSVIAGMRKLGETLVETTFPHISPMIIGESKMDEAELEQILKSEELPTEYYDQIGFFNPEKLAVLLHQILIDKDNTKNLQGILADLSLSFTNTPIMVKALVKTINDIDNSESLTEVNNFKIHFPVYFDGIKAPEAWDKIYDLYKSGEKNIDKAALKQGNIAESLGDPKAAPAPVLASKNVAYVLPSGVGINTPPLIAHCLKQADEINRELAFGNKAPLINLFGITLSKLSNAEIGIEDAANFMVYLQKIGNRFNQELPEQYANWFDQYKKLHEEE